jgi:hypothetical protein
MVREVETYDDTRRIDTAFLNVTSAKNPPRKVAAK